jgi:hypothetical protein
LGGRGDIPHQQELQPPPPQQQQQRPHTVQEQGTVEEGTEPPRDGRAPAPGVAGAHPFEILGTARRREAAEIEYEVALSGVGAPA